MGCVTSGRICEKVVEYQAIKMEQANIVIPYQGLGNYHEFVMAFR